MARVKNPRCFVDDHPMTVVMSEFYPDTRISKSILTGGEGFLKPENALFVPEMLDFIEDEENNTRYVPREWKVTMLETRIKIKENEGKDVSSIADAETKFIDRFVVEGTGNMTWDLCYLLATTSREFEFDECYEDVVEESAKLSALKMDFTMTLDETDKEHETKFPDLGGDYKWEMSEEILGMFGKKPTKEHAERLTKLAYSAGISLNYAWSYDYDIRLRKRFDRNSDRTIVTPCGSEYLFFNVFTSDPIVMEAIKGQLAPIWIKVGSRCALDSCDKRNPPLRCDRCKEARYCNGDHQAADWKNHKQHCRKVRK
jgi:hypothetical protein